MSPVLLAVRIEELPWPVVTALCAILTGLATFLWVRQALIDCELPVQSTPRTYAFLGTVLGGSFSLLMLNYGLQETPEVRPTEFWRVLRIPYHLLLIVGLLAVTATDLRAFYISTRVTIVGTVIGLLLATASGDLQMCHVWVDWNQEIPQIQGPYLPGWLSTHPHLHGLAWSSAGAVLGILLAWVVQLLGNLVLARPTLGTGDIYLMAMIGATLGWQATVVAFLLAPLCAILIGAVAKIAFNRPALPYGPFLAAGAVLVLFFWKRIWMLELRLAEAVSADDRLAVFAVRRFFGDWVSLTLVAGISLGGFVLLLGLLRLYQMIPVKGIEGDDVQR